MSRTRMAKPPVERLVDTQAACRRLGISRRSLYRWGDLGLVTVYKIGASNRYDVDELDAMVMRRRWAS
jgi:predicted site-specific integrase-resolvase